MQLLNKCFYVGLWVVAVSLSLVYLFLTGSETVNIPRIPLLIGTSIVGMLYLYIYRRNNLFCFETPFLLMYIISVFFYDIVFNNLPSTSVISSVFYNTSFTRTIENKGILVDSISLAAFLLAACRVNNKASINKVSDSFMIKRDYSMSVRIMTLIIGAYIIYVFANGTIATWFHYSNDSIVNYSNSEIMFLTVLFLILTSIEFASLNEKGCRNFKSFARNVNMVYMAEILVVSILLLISGNRNEGLLILLPLVIAYSIFIHRLSNRLFLLTFGVGIALMVVIGLTRQVGDMSSIKNESISLFDITRDYGFVDNNTKYLIEYADKNGCVGFKNALIALSSSVPFLGGVVLYTTGIEQDVRTTELTTSGMQVSSNMDSGLGTSLLGDLYYTGGFLFTIIFMYFLGWLIARQYRRFSIEKEFNIWSLIAYLFMFSNAVYYIRAEWIMPFRYIGFSYIILLVLHLFQPYNIHNKQLHQ